MRISLVSFGLALTLLGCSSDSPTPPTLDLPFAFPSGKLYIPTFRQDGASGANRDSAVASMAYWNSIADSLAPAMGLVVGAESATPQLLAADSSIVLLPSLSYQTYTGSLKATLISDSVTWELSASGPGITDYIWITGKSAEDGLGGYWNIKNKSNANWIRVIFYSVADSIRAENISSDAKAGSYAHHSLHGDTNSITVFEKRTSGNLMRTLTWSRATGAGQMLQFGSQNRWCWLPKSAGYADNPTCQ